MGPASQAARRAEDRRESVLKPARRIAAALAALLLVGCGGPTIHDPAEGLAGQMESPDAGQRLLAARALIDLEYLPEELTEKIRKLLDDPDPAVRAAAAEAVGAAGPEAAAWAKTLVERQNVETDRDVRDALQRAVEQIHAEPG